MKAHLRLDTALRLIATNEKGHETVFDTAIAGGGLGSAAGPMETVLEAAAACTTMDVLPILRKQRLIILDFWIDLTAERAHEHPKVFTKIVMDVHLTSPDATIKDLARAIELSHSKYCSVSVMLARSGCEISWKATLENPENQSKEYISSKVASKVVENLD
jgi:putative redox protein